jgi:hypothetical protein
MLVCMSILFCCGAASENQTLRPDYGGRDKKQHYLLVHSSLYLASFFALPLSRKPSNSHHQGLRHVLPWRPTANPHKKNSQRHPMAFMFRSTFKMKAGQQEQEKKKKRKRTSRKDICARESQENVFLFPQQFRAVFFLFSFLFLCLPTPPATPDETTWHFAIESRNASCIIAVQP